MYRFSGTGHDSGETVPWSLILKCAARKSDADDPAGLDYWKREYFVYISEFLNILTPGLIAPQCYHSMDTTDAYWLWLEDMAIWGNQPWSSADFGIAATHFGRWNGAFLVESALPNHPWLVKGRLRQRTLRTANSGLYADLASYQQHPLVQRSLPADIVAPVLDLWDDRESFLTALDQIPQTLQHGDAGRKNLILRRTDANQAETIAIDWGWSGIGPVGAELAPIVASASLWFIDVQPEDLPEVERIAFKGYLQGLREAGWLGDTELARLGYTASVALRFGPLLGWFENAATTENGRAYLCSFYSQPLEEVADRIAGIRRFALSRVQEARALLQAIE